MEINGTGEIVDGVPHMHVTAALENGSAMAGHLESGRVETWFVNVYVEPLA